MTSPFSCRPRHAVLCPCLSSPNPWGCNLLRGHWWQSCSPIYGSPVLQSCLLSTWLDRFRCQIQCSSQDPRDGSVDYFVSTWYFDSVSTYYAVNCCPLKFSSSSCKVAPGRLSSVSSADPETISEDCALSKVNWWERLDFWLSGASWTRLIASLLKGAVSIDSLSCWLCSYHLRVPYLGL